MAADLGGRIAADLLQIQQRAGQLDTTTDTPLANPADAGMGTGMGTGAPAGFAQTFSDAVHRVDAQEHDAVDRMNAVDAGQSDDLVGAMLASQQASLSFSMLMQVRNKVAGAVDDLIKLQL
jgi:flagellar hook-basal body complex protein FliE